MSEEKARALGRVFFSYGKDVSDFVGQFKRYFSDPQERLEFDDWLVTPVPAGELLKGLRQKISEADVFIAFVDADYRNRITASELKFALGSRPKGAPVLIPVMLGRTGEAWWNDMSTHVHIESELSEIVRQKFYESGTDTWRDLEKANEKQNVQRLRNWVIRELEAAAQRRTDQSSALPEGDVTPSRHEDPIQVPSRRLALLGTARGIFAEDVDRARNTLAEAFKGDNAFIEVSDGWNDPQLDPNPAAQAAHLVVEGAANSLLISVCDAERYREYSRVVGNPARSGKAFSNDLTLNGLGDEDVPKVLERTLFWVPRIEAELVKLGNVSIVPKDITESQGFSGGPQHGTAAPDALARWLREELGEAAPVVKAQSGLQRMGPKLYNDLKLVFGLPIDLEHYDATELPSKVREAVEKGVPIIVGIHDKAIEATVGNESEARVRGHAQEFAEKIRQAIDGIPAARVVGALLLCRFPNVLKGLETWTRAGLNWVIVPLDQDRPRPDRLALLRDELATRAGQ
jgi:hypothetical protein